MHDLGVSLHSHNYHDTFLAALDALADAPVFDKRYFEEGFKPSKEDSPVLNIKRTIPAFFSSDLEEYANRTDIEFQGTLAEYGRLAKSRLIEHILEHWDSTRPTLVSASSGYDSRILLKCLTELRNEGFELGTIHFRCHDPEGPTFLKVMERLGWPPESYSVFESPEEDSYDVGHWDRPGVAGWLPVVAQINYWRDIIPYEEEHEWNLFGGSGGGEAFEYPSQPKPPSVPWKYCANAPLQRWFSYFPDGTDVLAEVSGGFAKLMFPYFGERHIRTVAELPDKFLGFTGGEASSCDNVRASILNAFQDNTLDIPRAPRTYSWSISERRWSDMHVNYSNSRFLQVVPGAPDPDTLISEMRKEFFKNGKAERIWRFASLWEQHGRS